MDKFYLLLRNNKETGPFSITELLQLSLTANDLVWVQGKSAGWRYPFEIDELKEALSDSPLSNPIVSKNIEPVVAGLRKEERASPKKIFVSLPTVTKKQPEFTTPSFEEKAEALRQKALSFSKDKEDTTEVKYTRSLDEIKEEYTGWIQEQKIKRKGVSANKPLTFTVLFAAITAFVFFALQWNPKKEKALSTLTLAAKKITPVTNNQTSSAVAATEVTPVTNTQRNATVAARKEVQKRSESTANQLAAQKVSKEIFIKTVTEPFTTTDTLLTISKTADQPPVPLLKETALRKKEADIPIADLIETKSHYIQSKEGIGIAVQLHNKSAKSILVAAIDVLYFNKAKVQTAKETLYFSNVEPGTTLTKNSSYVKAASASYRIGLVSAERAGLYVMQ